MEHEFIIGEEVFTFQCDIDRNRGCAIFDNDKIEFDFTLPSLHRISLQQGERNYTVYYAKSERVLHLFIEGEKYVIKQAENKSDFGHDIAGVGGSGLVETPMPGTIVKFLVQEGDTVEAGQPLLIVEAMKMENEIRSPIKAIVKKINFKSGDAVDVGQPIIDLEKIEAE